MGFKNEFASIEDVDKFGLNEIWDQYRPQRKGRHYNGRKPNLTIDRSRNVFLMTVGQGHGEDGNRMLFLLWVDGRHIRADLTLSPESSQKFDDNPFRMVWDLAYFSVPEELRDNEGELLGLLRDALRARGYFGAQQQVENTEVSFNF